MANIINITRTYRFVNGIPLVNDQLESELSNIVDTVNKDLSYVTANIYLNSTITEASAISPSGTSNWNDVTSLNLTNGEWDIWGTVVWRSAGSGSTDVTRVNWGIGFTSGNNPPDNGLTLTSSVVPTFTTTVGQVSTWAEYILPIRFNSTPSSVTLYLKALAVYTNAPTIYGSLTARKVNL